jgi:hypothetical protein
MTYYTKSGDKIFRFKCWEDIENLTGKDKRLFKTMRFYKAIRHSIKSDRIISKWAAYFEGWIEKDGTPKIPYRSGNYES